MWANACHRQILPAEGNRMAALKSIDPSIKTLSLTNYSAFLKQAATVTHKRAAELLGIAPGTESEYCTEHMERLCQFLAAYGMKVVEKGAGATPPEQMRAFITLAAAHMERVELETRISQPADLGPPE
jgi:hypothetical protein